MKVSRVVWEDAEKNRDVELVVESRLVDGAVQIEKVTPASVTLYAACGELIKKVLPVTTKTGQRVLTRAYESSPGREAVEREVLEQHLAV